jgi:transposase
MVAATVAPERLIFVDECGTYTSLSPVYGYAPKGERLHLSVPQSRGKNTTLLSSMTTGGMGPSLAVEGATTARVFETYVEKVLVPSLERGQIVVMVNLGAHRPKRIGELIEQRGCELLYLPPYSPDFNPIEICQPQCAFKHKLSYHWPRRAARTTGVGREARSRPPTQRRGGSAMSSRGAVPPRP